MSDAPAAKRRPPGLAVYALAASYGFAGALLTGDWGKGMAVAGLVFVILAALLLLFPRHVHTEPRRYLLHALVVAVSPFVALKLGLARTAWIDLQDRYASTGAPAGEPASGREVVIVQAVDEFMIRPSAFGSIATTFGEGGIHLAPRWPARIIYRPLRFQLPGIAACGDSVMNTGFTRVELFGTRTAVEVLDPDRRLLEWCRQRGKPGRALGP